jgi:hypothetical protein
MFTDNPNLTQLGEKAFVYKNFVPKALVEKINKFYDAKEDYRSFCSGVMLIHKNFLNKTRDHWRPLLYTYDKRGEKDQGIFNKLIIDHYDGRYNELCESWGSWYRYGKYIDHLGGPFRKPSFKLDEYMKKFRIFDYINKDKLNLMDFI